MDIVFEELDYRDTPIGEIVLRRRTEPRLGGREVFEVKLGDEFLMSSLFTVGEEALANLALGELGDGLDVVVGGLGLGYTAAAALGHEGVASLVVVEALEAVIDWHRRALVPLGAQIAGDPRCRLVEADFFARASDPDAGFDPERPGRRFHAVLLDIDHSPRHWLAPANAAFYSAPALATLGKHLHPGGVFAMWSNDRPDLAFKAELARAFTDTESRIVDFPNPYTGERSACTVYLGRTADG